MFFSNLNTLIIILLLIIKSETDNNKNMKALKTIKYALVIAAIFTFSGCELIEEPNMDEATTCTGCTEKGTGDLD